MNNGLIVVSLLLMWSCSNGTVKSESELREWLREHGLSTRQVVGDYIVELSFAPRQTLHSNQNQAPEYSTFVVDIESAGDTSSQHDPIYDNVASAEVFGQRIRDFALAFHEQVHMKVHDKEFKCVGAQLDYHLGLTNKRRLYLVFAVTEDQLREVNETKIVVESIILDERSAEFSLSTANIKRIPEIES